MIPQISIIIPVYRAEAYIKQCVNSILNQSFHNIELILIDDGSPDGSGLICDELAEKDCRIKVIHKNNGGVSSARNAGVRIANGKYLMFCDSDDYVSEDWCAWLYNVMETGNIHLAACGVESLSNGKSVNYRGVEPCTIVPRTEFVKMASSINLFELWNKIFITEIVRKNNLKFDERISRCEDALFTLKYLQLIGENDCLCYGSPALYHYNVSTMGSLTKCYVKDYWQIEKEVLTEFCAVMSRYGIQEEEYIELYSEKAALVFLGVIANLMRSREYSFVMKYRELQKIISSKEYEVAILFGGMSKVASGLFLYILERKNPTLIFMYYCFSKIKSELFRK